MPAFKARQQVAELGRLKLQDTNGPIAAAASSTQFAGS
jgi:hypothetical protein